MMKFAVFFMASMFFSQFNATGQEPTDPCVRRSITMSRKADLGVEVISHFFSHEKHFVSESLLGEIVLRNSTTRSVTGIEMTVAYFDEHGAYLFSIHYFASLRGANRLAASFYAFYENEFEGGISPGEYFFLMGTNLMSTARIPSRGEVSSISLHFADGYSSRGPGVAAHRLEPVLRNVPQLEMSAWPQGDLPAWVLWTIELGADGKVMKLKASDASEVKLADLRKNIENWHFYPSLRDGYAVESEIRLLIRFWPNGPVLVRRCFEDLPQDSPSLFVLVDLVYEAGHWSLSYGGYPAEGTFERQVVSSGRAIQLEN